MKSLQIPRTIAGTNSASPVNSRVKKAWLSFGSDDISLRSSRGAQDTPTAYMVMPNDRWAGQTGHVREILVRHEHRLLLPSLEFNTHLGSVQPTPVVWHHHRICHPSPQLGSCGLVLSAWWAQRKRRWILLRKLTHTSDFSGPNIALLSCHILQQWAASSSHRRLQIPQIEINIQM